VAPAAAIVDAASVAQAQAQAQARVARPEQGSNTQRAAPPAGELARGVSAPGALEAGSRGDKLVVEAEAAPAPAPAPASDGLAEEEGPEDDDDDVVGEEVSVPAGNCPFSPEQLLAVKRAMSSIQPRSDASTKDMKSAGIVEYTLTKRELPKRQPGSGN